MAWCVLNVPCKNLDMCTCTCANGTKMSDELKVEDLSHRGREVSAVCVYTAILTQVSLRIFICLEDSISSVLITSSGRQVDEMHFRPRILLLDNSREHFTNWLPINYFSHWRNIANAEMRNWFDAMHALIPHTPD